MCASSVHPKNATELWSHHGHWPRCKRSPAPQWPFPRLGLMPGTWFWPCQSSVFALPHYPWCLRIRTEYCCTNHAWFRTWVQWCNEKNEHFSGKITRKINFLQLHCLSLSLICASKSTSGNEQCCKWKIYGSLGRSYWQSSSGKRSLPIANQAYFSIGKTCLPIANQAHSTLLADMEMTTLEYRMKVPVL